MPRYAERSAMLQTHFMQGGQHAVFDLWNTHTNSTNGILKNNECYFVLRRFFSCDFGTSGPRMPRAGPSVVLTVGGGTHNVL